MKGILSQLGLRDIADIALVSLVLYHLLVLVKGTRAAKMLLGLGVLIVASIAARHIPLYTLDWLLQGLWAYIIIAVIVVFQPEIRRALASMGESRLFSAFTSAEELKGLDEVIRGVVSLSNSRTGALLVIERGTALDDFVELGTPLEARVSMELLMSIFHPASPMHDGAVIIRGNRVLAAGCFLPIALTPAIARDFGTRHRAALGITEETDCVVLVVSEETGGMSLSMQGKIEALGDMDALRHRLTDIFTHKHTAGHRA